jgi:hypothetical protein
MHRETLHRRLELQVGSTGRTTIWPPRRTCGQLCAKATASSRLVADTRKNPRTGAPSGNAAPIVLVVSLRRWPVI